MLDRCGHRWSVRNTCAPAATYGSDYPAHSSLRVAAVTGGSQMNHAGSLQTIREDLKSAVAREENADFKVVLSRISSLIDRRTSNTAQVSAIRDILDSVSCLAFRDELTGLYNRRGFMRGAEKLLSMSRREQSQFVLFFLDVDQLSFINDNSGHAAGDALLRGAARALRATFRRSDIVGRLGGDEFGALAVVTSGISEQSLRERLGRAIRRENINSEGPSVSLSVGTAYFDRTTPQSFETLLAHADRNMYAQKHRLSSCAT